MRWAEERKKLEVLSQLPSANSPFKKKLTIINRMKNITPESFPIIIQEIKSENLQKFSVEIVNSLLSHTKANTQEDVHNIVRILYLYSYDRTFITVFITAARKILPQSWINGALLAEAYFLMNGNLDGVMFELIKASEENAVYVINYIVCNFENIDITIIEKKTRELLENVTERNIEALAGICGVLGWNTHLEVEEDFVDVIKMEKDEFEFYRKTPAEAIDGVRSESSSCDLRMIENNPQNMAVLGAIAAYVSGNQDLIGRVIKKAKNIALAPAVACIISQLSKGRSTAISQVFTADYDSIAHYELVLIGEMYKFSIIRSSDILNILSFYFKNRNVEKLCILLENVGRYMLVRRETNKSIREFINRLEGYPWREIDRLCVNNCLSRIYKVGSSEIDIMGFFRWAFSKNTFYTSNLFELIKSSKRLLYILFSLPELFGNEAFLIKLIRKVRMTEEMIDFYINSIEPMTRHSRLRGYYMVDTLALLLKEQDVTVQTRVLERTWSFDLSIDVRCSMILSLLDHCNVLLHGKYISILSWSSLSTESRNQLFNFCEKYNYEEFERENCEFDSFEKEMAELREE
ncbi:hypothetical protein PAEPH01_0076 [Pancytospora epiphaga]|nr:hypothetical protein PAEPH01_0076 [Pancytospora epiphaga]